MMTCFVYCYLHAFQSRRSFGSGASAVMQLLLHAVQLRASRGTFAMFWPLALLCAILLRVTLNGGWGYISRRWQLRHNERAWLTEQLVAGKAAVPPQSINPFLAKTAPCKLNQVCPEVVATVAAKVPMPHQQTIIGRLPSASSRQRAAASAEDKRISYCGVGGGGSLAIAATRPGSAKLPSRQDMLAMAVAGVR